MALLTFAMASFLLLPTSDGASDHGRADRAADLDASRRRLLAPGRPRLPLARPRCRRDPARLPRRRAAAGGAGNLRHRHAGAATRCSVNGTIGGTASAKWRFFQEDEQPLEGKVSAIGLEHGALPGHSRFADPAGRAGRHPQADVALRAVLGAGRRALPGAVPRRLRSLLLPLPAPDAAAAGRARRRRRRLSHRPRQAETRRRRRGRSSPARWWSPSCRCGSSTRRWQDNYTQASFETYDDLEQMALDLNTIIRPDQTLATHDIGAVGYFGKFQMLDMVGLVNAEVIPYHENRTFPRYFDVVGAGLPAGLPGVGPLVPCTSAPGPASGALPAGQVLPRRADSRLAVRPLSRARQRPLGSSRAGPALRPAQARSAPSPPRSRRRAPTRRRRSPPSL